MHDGFIKSRKSPAAIPPYSLIAFTGTASEVRTATAPADPAAGVSDSQGSDAGGLCDVQMSQIAEVRAGGTIAAGDRLTASAGGRAVKAVKQAGAVVTVWGVAQRDALENDIVPILCAFGAIDG